MSASTRVALSFAISAAATAGLACGTKHNTTNIITSDPSRVQVAPGQPIKIAAMFGYRDLGAYATDPGNAVALAASERGTIHGHSITVVQVDDGCFDGYNGGAAAAATVLAAGDIVGVIGTTCSGAAFGAEGGLCASDIPMISPSNTNPGLTDPATHQRCYFRTAYSDVVQGQRMADYATSTVGATHAVTIYEQGNPYSTALSQAFADAFADGSHVVSQVPITLSGGSPTAAIDAALAAVIAADSSVDFLFFPLQDAATNAAVVTEARADSSFDGVQLASGDGAVASDFITDAGSDALTPPAVIASGPALVFAGAAFQHFTTAYAAKFGSFPADEAFLPHAYDAANVLLDAIELIAEDQGGTLVISRPALVSAVYATSGLGAVTGTLTADPSGELNPDPSVVVFKVVSGNSGSAFEPAP
jgi:branched-chain amino acid transport system substrate-binding protein